MSIIILHQRFCEYKTTFENLSPKTIKWHEMLFKSFVKFSSVSSIAEVNKKIVENWIIWGKTSRDWSPKTIRSSLVSLNVYLFLAWTRI